MPKKTNKRKKNQQMVQKNLAGVSTRGEAANPQNSPVKSAILKPGNVALTQEQLKAGMKTVLHVGCGQKTQKDMPELFQSKDWKEVRLDITKQVNPDIIADMLDMSIVPSESHHALYSSHNVEHVYNYQVPKVLSEFFRVLKWGGGVVITLPDIEAVSLIAAQGKLEDPIYESESGGISALDIIYGHGESLKAGHHYMAHKTGFTARTLAQKMLDAGFSNITVSRDAHLNLWAKGTKLKEGHPQRKHSAQMKGHYAFTVVPVSLPDVPVGQRLDELDKEPQLWRPLNLSLEI